jgi:glycosyltransferase involved in cell wall biosynthesis
VALGSASVEVSRALENYAAEIGVADRFFQIEPVPCQDVVRAAAAADIGVIPILPTTDSYKFCWPNKLFELLNAGLPIVVGPLPDVAEVVEKNKIGVSCAACAPECFAEAILHVQNRKDEYRPSGTRLSLLQERYTWEAYAADLVRLYAGFLTGRAARKKHLLGFLSPAAWLKACSAGPDPASACVPVQHDRSKAGWAESFMRTA